MPHSGKDRWRMVTVKGWNYLSQNKLVARTTITKHGKIIIMIGFAGNRKAAENIFDRIIERNTAKKTNLPKNKRDWSKSAENKVDAAPLPQQPAVIVGQPEVFDASRTEAITGRTGNA